MRQKINIISLGVRDIGKAAAFYEKGLGWKRSPLSQGDFIIFPLGGAALALYPRDRLAEDAGVEDGPAAFSGITISYNAKSAGEVDAVLAEVERLGADIVKPAAKTFRGEYNGYFRDPDGHLFEVAWGPMFRFDENDNLIL